MPLAEPAVVGDPLAPFAVPHTSFRLDQSKTAISRVFGYRPLTIHALLVFLVGFIGLQGKAQEEIDSYIQLCQATVFEPCRLVIIPESDADNYVNFVDKRYGENSAIIVE